LKPREFAEEEHNMKGRIKEAMPRLPKVFAMWLKPGPWGGQIDLTYEALIKGVIILGWNQFKDDPTMDDDHLRLHLRKRKLSTYEANQIFRFVREMKPGDMVLVPHREHPSTHPRDLTCYAATVRSNKVKRAHFGGSHGWEMPYREVEWYSLAPYARRRFPKALRDALMYRQTVWDITCLRPLLKGVLSGAAAA
jgi:hypothetical protein